MKVLGIDIGTVNLGFAVIENRNLIFSTTIKLNSKDSLGVRLNELETLFCSYLQEHDVEGVIIERPTIRQTDLYYPCGLFCYLSCRENVEYQEVNPVSVKKLIAGTGKATKKELEEAMRHMVDNPPKKFKSDHESDSVAIALCWRK